MFLLRLIWAVVHALVAERAELSVLAPHGADGRDVGGRGRAVEARDLRADGAVGAGGGGLGDKLRLTVSYVEGRKHLPIIELRRAA